VLDKSTKLLKSKKLEYEQAVNENQITTSTTTTTSTTMISTDFIRHIKSKLKNKDLDEISNDADVDEDDLTRVTQIENIKLNQDYSALIASNDSIQLGVG
jgi:hypothetical protein